MKRRNFIKAAAGALAALPFAGLAGKTQAKPETINRGLTFDEWLAKQPAAIQEEILGPLNDRAFLKPAPMAWPGVTPINSQEIRADRQIADIVIVDIESAWLKASDARKGEALVQAEKFLKK